MQYAGQSGLINLQGKITFWNDEKNYGIITPNSSAKQVFVHVRAV